MAFIFAEISLRLVSDIPITLLIVGGCFTLACIVSILLVRLAILVSNDCISAGFNNLVGLLAILFFNSCNLLNFSLASSKLLVGSLVTTDTSIFKAFLWAFAALLEFISSCL